MNTIKKKKEKTSYKVTQKTKLNRYCTINKINISE